MAGSTAKPRTMQDSTIQMASPEAATPAGGCAEHSDRPARRCRLRRSPDTYRRRGPYPHAVASWPKKASRATMPFPHHRHLFAHPGGPVDRPQPSPGSAAGTIAELGNVAFDGYTGVMARKTSGDSSPRFSRLLRLPLRRPSANGTTPRPSRRNRPCRTHSTAGRRDG